MMMNMVPDDDFFVEDEPLEDVLAAFDAGIKGVTRPPVGQNRSFTFMAAGGNDVVSGPEENRLTGRLVHC